MRKLMCTQPVAKNVAMSTGYAEPNGEIDMGLMCQMCGLLSSKIIVVGTNSRTLTSRVLTFLASTRLIKNHSNI
jgi:hypothetical protein